MALRLVDVTVPTRDAQSLVDAIPPDHAVEVWRDDIGEGMTRVRVLARAERVEAITDAIASRFEYRPGFRVVLVDVEAVYPPLDDDASDEPAPDDTRGRISREELYDRIERGARLRVEYLLLVALSTVAAAVGLLRDDAAVVIGAMVIAPLLGPNMGLALASTLGDLALAARSARAVVAGVAVALALALAIGALVHVDAVPRELAARSRVSLADVVVALAAGSAGAIAVTSGVAESLIGVMVAVALLPPLVAAGLFAGAGEAASALRALMLVVTNVACVNLAAVVTFLVRRVRPRTWWEAERARRATRIAVASWVGMLALLVASILLFRTG